MQMGCEACLHFYCKKANVCRNYWSKEGNWRIFFYTRIFLAGRAE